MIEVRDLCKNYGSVRAVDHVSFDVQEGEIVGFLGPNGAGKTTTIRILTCFQPPTSGGARVAGCDVLKESMGVRERIGYLPESTPLYPEMRAIEYLRFRAQLRGLEPAERDRAIERVAERCWIRDVLRRPIGQLSKGYRQRVGLADALLHNPPVLILDEPTVGLDPSQIRETRSLIRELAQDHTVMLSSHILPEVEATCQRIIVIHRGRIVAAGTPAELRERLSDESHLLVEVKAESAAQAAAMQKQIGALTGVEALEATHTPPWLRLRIDARRDLREDVYNLARSHDWLLRELRLEVASLEDFFVKIVTSDGQAA